MDFELNEELKMLQAAVKDLSVSQFEKLAEKVDQEQKFAMENFKAMAGMGLTGFTIPPEYGGSGGSNLGLVVATEEIARACASTADILDGHLCLCTEPIFFFGNEDQRKRFVVPLAKGEKVGSFAVTEAEAGSDLSRIQSVAIKKGNEYIITGTKIFITNGDAADLALIFANVPELGKRGMTAFVVEAGTKGFTKGKKYNKLGMHGATNCDSVFEECHVPAANRIGDEGMGMKIALAAIDHGRMGIAAQGNGITQAVLDRSVDYAKTRVQFGAPISANQGVSFALADMGMQLEASRLLAYKAASLADNGQPFATIAAMAKLTASELCMRAAVQGIQTLGGYGYMMDSPMQRYFRDAKLIAIYEGTSEVQRMVIARAVLNAPRR